LAILSFFTCPLRLCETTATFLLQVSMHICRFNNLESHYDNGDTTALKLFMKFFYNKVNLNQFVTAMRFTKEKT